MRILHLNTFDHNGGAARAVYWLHSGMQKVGVESRMFVQHKTSGERAIRTESGRLTMILKEIRWIIDSLPLICYPNRDVTHWSTGWFPHNIKKYVKEINPDIIHLHWICRGFLSISEIATLCSLGRPIVWTLHDSWAFTGGCHIPGDCLKYRSKCGHCPQLSSAGSNDLSRRILKRKTKKWKQNKLILVAPSKWLTECIKQSSLFNRNRALTIPNGIDTDVFTSVDKKLARSLLRLPESPKVKILCGGINAHGDPNKGFHLLHQAMEQLAQTGWQDKIELIIYGESEPSESSMLPLETHYLGILHDNETLRLAYSAADIFVLPSLQENLPNSILESLACNTPVVAFAAGGIPDIFEEMENSYLAKPFEVADLVNRIKQAMAEEKRPVLNKRFTQRNSVEQYLSLYRELTDA